MNLAIPDHSGFAVGDRHPLAAVRILTEYERGVVFRFGRFSRREAGRAALDHSRVSIAWFRVSLREIVMDVPSAGGDHPRQRLGEGERGALLPRTAPRRRR